MGDGALHILSATVDGPSGLFRAYFDGVPALVPSFISATTPAVGPAQIGGSSSSRSRRFHGLIAEVVHYDRVLSTRQMHAIGHYLQHKYRIAGGYTDEAMAIDVANSSAAASAAGGVLGGIFAAASSEGGSDGATDGARLAQLQLMLPPERGCITHRGALRTIALESCDETRPAQLWAWDAATCGACARTIAVPTCRSRAAGTLGSWLLVTGRSVADTLGGSSPGYGCLIGDRSQLHFGTDRAQCLAWFADEDRFGAWPCEVRAGSSERKWS